MEAPPSWGAAPTPAEQRAFGSDSASTTAESRPLPRPAFAFGRSPVTPRNLQGAAAVEPPSQGEHDN
jgi:hypothetical protein